MIHIYVLHQTYQTSDIPVSEIFSEPHSLCLKPPREVGAPVRCSPPPTPDFILHSKFSLDKYACSQGMHMYEYV